MVYLANGEREKAVDQLERAIEKIDSYTVDPGFYNLMIIRTNVTADPILEQAEFVRLRARLRGN